MLSPEQNLVRMANQIASNNGHWPTEQECIERTAGHIKRFWAPSMIDKLRPLSGDLSELAQKSLDLLETS